MSLEDWSLENKFPRRTRRFVGHFIFLTYIMDASIFKRIKYALAYAFMSKKEIAAIKVACEETKAFWGQAFPEEK